MTKIQKDNEIGTIASWGPFFRVSFDLIVHSHVQDDWSNVLSFKGNGGNSDLSQIGDTIPAILFSKDKSELRITNTGDGNANFHFDFKIDLKHWYNILIEQKPKNKKVRKNHKSIIISLV